MAYYWMELCSLPFDSNEWKRARIVRRYDICFRMKESLVNKLSTEKITENRLIELLGKPDDDLSTGIWEYSLGVHWSLLFPDGWRLTIYINPENHVIVKAVAHAT